MTGPRRPAPAPPASPAVAGPARRGRDRPVVVAVLAAIFAASIAATMLRSPHGVIGSADPGYAPTPVPLLLVPALLCIGLVLLLPRGSGDGSVAVVRPDRARAEAGALLALVLAFPLLVPLLPLPEDYVLLKLLLFLLLPCLGLWLSGRREGPAVRADRPRIGPWALVPALVLGVLSTVGPFSGGLPSSWPPPATLLVAATATAITASFGEELMYRRFLQTRLEALTGPWTGILLTSLVFALMHVPTHGEGPLPAVLAQAIALQGTFGLAVGVLWARYRRLELCVLAHLLVNGLGVALHLVGLV
ncbi:CPBP family intramembrane glutamic endopeptidase [Brachybacterium hainanense]|uniref:Lysostaphin resistance A-like protein n=1 Tax=Brachybacterium hainanense TaxID=1541174 RepID=A0ABV6RFU9_9MICO